METIALILQIIIAFGIINVWIFRFGRATDWRGGDATNMKEEFAVYGLPVWFMKIIGFLKLLLAAGLIIGIWLPNFTNPSAIGMAVLMLGAIIMHIRVSDPLKKSLPAFTLLVLSIIVVLI